MLYGIPSQLRMNTKRLNVKVYKNMGLVSVDGVLYSVVDASRYLINFEDMEDFQLVRVSFNIQTSDSAVKTPCLSILKFTATWAPLFGGSRVGCAMLLDPTVNKTTLMRWLVSLQRAVRWKLGAPRRLCVGMALHARLGRDAPIAALGTDLCAFIATKC